MPRFSPWALGAPLRARRGLASLALGFCLVAGLLAPPAAAAADSTEAADVTVAVVNGTAIRGSELLLAYEALPEQYRGQPAGLLIGAIVEQLIDLKLMAALARERGLAEDPAVLARVVFFKEQLLRQSYLTALVEERVTDDLLHARFELLKERTPAHDEVRASHILLSSEADAQAVAEALQGGADFAALARERSIGPSGPKGGDLGYFTRDRMIPEFSDAAFALAVGEVSAPVQSEYGWHVIKLEDRRTAPPPSYEESVWSVRDILTQEVVTEAVRAAREGAVIERRDVDPGILGLGAAAGEAPPPAVSAQ